MSDRRFHFWQRWLYHACNVAAVAAMAPPLAPTWSAFAGQEAVR